MEIDTLFRPTSASVRQLLKDYVGGFAIPSYQRPYRWDPADIRRLLEDLINGLDRLAQDENAVAFIGAIITVSDVSQAHHTRPREAKQVIDGQQRLSTILMCIAALHERVSGLVSRTERERLPDEAPPGQLAVYEWLLEQAAEVQTQLMDCLAEERTTGDGNYRYLPKIVREIVDSWSNRSASAQYRSPIANLIFGFIDATHSGQRFDPSVPSTTEEPPAAGSSPDDHQTLHRRFANIRDYAGQIASGNADRDFSERIDIGMLLGRDSKVLESLFSDLPLESADESKAELRVLSAELGDNTTALIRLLLIARFLLERIALTQINAKNEAYAFDLFDALNTTGEPLTAFETFVPLVVEAEGRDEYSSSSSFLHVSSVSRMIAEHDGDVQKSTARLVTAFLLADCGLKVSLRHNDQRHELGRRYRTAPSINVQREMTAHLTHVGSTYFRTWQRAEMPDSTGEILELDPATTLCLRFLRAINHTVVVAPIARYFAAYVGARSDEPDVDSVAASVRMFTAFSVLWRAVHGGTSGIDGEYRRLMSTGISPMTSGLARTALGEHVVQELSDLSTVSAALLSILRNQQALSFESKEQWVGLAAKRPIYEEQPTLARFMLLLASHHAVPDGSSGLTRDATHSDSTDMLRGERWDDDRLATIEHIVPQTQPDDLPSEDRWDVEIFQNPATIHQLGNLVLLPLADNAAIGNRSWEDKRRIYSALASESVDEARAAIREARSQGTQIGDELASAIVERRRHLPVVAAVANFEGEWSTEFIERRSEHLLVRAWQILSAWLSPDARGES